MTLLAFHNDGKIKTKYINRVKEHRERDELIKGEYWKDGKGCAVGCTIHSGEHKDYESELGIPEWLARLEDRIFEGLEDKEARLWPEKFLSAIKPGINLEKIKPSIIVFILESCIESIGACVYDYKKYPETKATIEQSVTAIKEVIRCHKEGLELRTAERAESVACTAANAAWAAERAESAAWWAAESAKSAANAAWCTAENAAWWAAESAEGTARSAAYKKYADKILELISDLEPEELEGE